MTNMERLYGIRPGYPGYPARSACHDSSLPLSTSFDMARSIKLLSCVASFLFFSSLAASYEVPIRDKDYSRQICSGMWSDQHTFINGTRSLIDLYALLNSG
jgi:hypothetical protein